MSGDGALCNMFRLDERGAYGIAGEMSGSRRHCLPPGI